MAIDDVFDFGFTSANLEELDEWQQSQSELSSASEEATVYKARLDKLYKSFLPLLTNLKQIPKKTISFGQNGRQRSRRSKSI